MVDPLPRAVPSCTVDDPQQHEPTPETPDPCLRSQGRVGQGKAERLPAAVLRGCEASTCEAQFSRHWERAGLLPASSTSECPFTFKVSEYVFQKKNNF